MVDSGTILNDESIIETLFNQYEENINSINDSVWQGASKNNLVAKSQEFVGQYKGKISGQMNNLAQAANLFKTYKEQKDAFELAEKNYNNAVAAKDDAGASNYQNQMTSAKSQMDNLKPQIDSLLETICGDAVNKVGTQYMDINVSALLSQMKNLKKLEDGKSLASLYEDGYVEKVLEDIKKNAANGREAGVMSALTLIKLAADKGVKLDYTMGASHGTTTTTSGILKSSDCSSFASYILNQGTSKNIETMTTATIKSKYSNCKKDYKDAKPGDLLNKNNGSSGHVEVIIENHPEQGYFITAEANSSAVGVQLAKTTYSLCQKEGHNAYNMDNVYDK